MTTINKSITEDFKDVKGMSSNQGSEKTDVLANDLNCFKNKLNARKSSQNWENSILMKILNHGTRNTSKHRTLNILQGGHTKHLDKTLSVISPLFSP